MEIESIKMADARYPSNLAEIYDPPEELFYVGNLEILKREKFAIVGTRLATSYGENQAFSFAKEISSKGICIVSGLAFGIDAAAHRGALKGEGGTIAVIAQDLNNISPASNFGLAMEIVKKGGLLLSENPGHAVLKHEYLKRNRIISGLSKGVLVVEAAARSGSLNTANHALNHGRELFLMPGRITDLQSKGANEMLKHYGYLTTDVGVIFEECGWNYVKDESLRLSGLLKNVYLHIRASPGTASDCAEKFVATELYPALAALEEKGLLKCAANGRYSVIGK